MNVKQLAPKNITVGERHRPVGDVASLAASIDRLGFLHPIVVAEDYTLIAGARRLAAAKMLGLHTVPAHIMELTADERATAELEENYERQELDALARAEHLQTLKQIYERKHPETAHGRAPKPKADPAPKKEEKSENPREKGKEDTVSSFPPPKTAASEPEPKPESKPPSFTEHEAKKTGRSARRIRADIAIADALDPEAKEAIRGLPIADSPKQLAALANQDTPTQREAAKLIRAGKAATVKNALKAIADKPDPDAPPWASFEKQIRELMGELRSVSRRLGEVIEYDPSTKQVRGKWCWGYSFMGTVGAVNTIVRNLEHGLPVKVAKNEHGYITKALDRQEADFAKRA